MAAFQIGELEKYFSELVDKHIGIIQVPVLKRIFHFFTFEDKY
jgi:hypothetical protein